MINKRTKLREMSDSSLSCLRIQYNVVFINSIWLRRIQQYLQASRTLLSFKSMPSINIIGAGASTCTRRVAAVCKELGVVYTIKTVDFTALKTPEHLEIQPFGQIPILEDPEDGFLLYGE